MMRNTIGTIGGSGGILAWIRTDSVVSNIKVDTTSIETITASIFGSITIPSIIEAVFFAILGTIVALLTREVFIWIKSKIKK